MSTAEVWAKQDQHPGDRHRLFVAVGEALEVASVLYPGCYVDLAPSFVWRDVTYVDVDRRAERFFADIVGVRAIVAAHDGAPSEPRISFVRADYTDDLPFEAGSFDLVISLYAGPISMYCTRYLAVGGFLLANPSHGDVALASIDDRYELHGVVRSRSGSYSVSTSDLDSHLVPKRPVEVTTELIERTGRGIAYTRSAFAYLFRRVR